MCKHPQPGSEVDVVEEGDQICEELLATSYPLSPSKCRHRKMTMKIFG